MGTDERKLAMTMFLTEERGCSSSVAGRAALAMMPLDDAHRPSRGFEKAARRIARQFSKQAKKLHADELDLYALATLEALRNLAREHGEVYYGERYDVALAAVDEEGEDANADPAKDAWREGKDDASAYVAPVDPDELDPGRALHRAVEALLDDDWPLIAGEEVFACKFKGENATWGFFVQGEEESERVVFYSTLDASVPEARRSDVAELMTRINYALWLGNFEMDFADGELRFTTSFDATVSVQSMTDEMIEQVALANVSTFDAYYPALMAVIHGGRTAEEALARLTT